MAKISAKGAVITIASTDLSSYCDSYEIDWGQQVDEVTGFGDQWKNSLAGIPIVKVILNVFWEKTATTGAFAKFKALMGTPGTCSIVPEATGPAFSGTFFCAGVKVSGKSNSSAVTMGSVELVPSGVTLATFA